MTKRKQQKDISSFFTKHVHREIEENSTPTPNTIPYDQSQVHSSPSNHNEENDIEVEYPSNIGNPPIIDGGRLSQIDVINLPQDPGKRRKMSDFHKDDRDIVRREYCSRKLCQPKDYNFPFTTFGKTNRRFNPKWFDTYGNWLEYSVEKDAAFCFPCYLFKNDSVGQDAFVVDGFRTWSKPSALEKHVGPHKSAHRQVQDTTSITLKNAIEALLMEHSLTLSKVRGQGYDGASNMQGSIGGLKTLILNECESAYYIHCFAHQLQLTLVAVAKKNDDCRWLFEEVLPLLLNFLGGSPKRREFLRAKQKHRVVEAFSLGELETGIGLNQELNLARPADTRWGSHFKTLKNVTSLFKSINESLDAIAVAIPSEKNKACAIMGMLMTFDFVFLLHLMGAIFGITNNLSLALQKKEQDIVNAMAMVDVAKKNLQSLRDNGWETHLNKVISFIEGQSLDIDVPIMEAMYVKPGYGRRLVRSDASKVTNLHHFRVEVFLSVLDQQLQEIENRFSEKSKELLICMSCFNPTNRFSSFNVPKLLKLAEAYPEEFPDGELCFFEHSLQNFVDDLRGDERFHDLKNLNELSMRLVETGKHETHADVYLLLKLVLLLPVATASVERAFSGMNFVKSKVRNSMGDELLNDCLVTYLERDLFLNVSLDDVVNRFQNMRTRREQL